MMEMVSEFQRNPIGRAPTSLRRSPTPPRLPTIDLSGDEAALEASLRRLFDERVALLSSSGELSKVRSLQSIVDETLFVMELIALDTKSCDGMHKHFFILPEQKAI